MRKHATTICISSSVLLHCHRSHRHRVRWKKNHLFLNTKKVSNSYDYDVKLENMISIYSEASEMRLVIYYIISCISSFSFLKDVRYFWRLEIVLKSQEWFMCCTCALLRAPSTLQCIPCQLMHQPFYQCTRQDLKELFPTKSSLWIFQIFSPGTWYYRVWQHAAREKETTPL